MQDKKSLFVTFFTTAEAIATEDICKTAGIDGKLVPVPRVLSAGCGISWKADEKDKDKIEKLLEDEDIQYEEIAIL